MSTLTLQATHVGPEFLRHLRAEFGVHLVSIDTPAPIFTFDGPTQDLRAMARRYFTEESYDLVEEPCY